MHIYKKKIPKVQHKLHNYMTNMYNTKQTQKSNSGKTVELKPQYKQAKVAFWVLELPS